jgi:methyl-accepting chemotaxis protein
MIWLKPATIAQKLIASFILLSLIWCLLCAFIIKLLLNLDASNAALMERQASIMAKSGDIQYQTAMQSYSLASYMATTGAGALGDTKAEEALKLANRRVAEVLEGLRVSLEDSAAHEHLDAIGQSNIRFAELADQILTLAQDNRVKAEVLMQTEAGRLSKIIIKAASELSQRQQELVSNERLHKREEAGRAISIMLWFAGLLLLASVAGSYYVSRKLTKPIVSIVGYTKQVAQGNLENSEWNVASRDEIGLLYGHFKVMTDNLRGLIASMATSSETIVNALGQWKRSAIHTSKSSRSIAEAMQQVQTSFHAQRHEITMTLRSAGEVAAGVEQINTATAESVQRFERMLQLTAASGGEMEETVRQMAAINEAVGAVESQFGQLRSRAENIGRVIQMIVVIAKQTNLLALNASIEASRAGASGKGFAVIANEIRLLSQQSGQSAKAAQEIVEQIWASVDMMNERVTQSVGEVQGGIVSVCKAEEAFRTISGSIEDSADEIGKISEAARRIKEMAEKMTKVFEQIDSVTLAPAGKTVEVSAAVQEQLAAMDELNAAAEGLSGMAQQLDEGVKRFNW